MTEADWVLMGVCMAIPGIPVICMLIVLAIDGRSGLKAYMRNL